MWWWEEARCPTGSRWTSLPCALPRTGSGAPSSTLAVAGGGALAAVGAASLAGAGFIDLALNAAWTIHVDH